MMEARYEQLATPSDMTLEYSKQVTGRIKGLL